MTREIAAKIAGNMVREFAPEGRFALSLPSRSDLQLFADSFVHEHGCRVVWNEELNKIAVRCPEHVLFKVEAG